MSDTHLDDTALGQLEREDRDIMQMARTIDTLRGSSVEDRAEYGKLAKKLIRHVAVREAALVDVLKALDGDERAQPMCERIAQNTADRRARIDQVERMSRGIQGINLNTGQDFDAELRALLETLGGEIQWELLGGLGEMRRELQAAEAETDLHSAHHVSKHAPTNLNPKGPRWFERAPVISRVIALYDRMRDFPKAAKDG
jgi:hypothetical protein